MSEPVPITHNQPAYSVTEIALGVKHLVEENFGRVRVRGELSQFKVHGASGHAYFTMKDEKSCLNAVCWKGSLAKLGMKPEDGMEVIATGKMTTYPGKSQYQLVVDRMEIAGEGALMALLEKRKKMLAAEGLFDAERKKAIPFLPEVIGVITSPTGAVIRDILHRLEDRFPRRVIVWPVLVQGEGAAEQVAAAIEGFHAMKIRPDVLIVARGGGSIEDLWAFNEEIVVRAVAASAIPIISAVGHETDTTLIDFVSDKRAPTPTAAAEMAVPVRAELVASVEMMGARAQVAVQRKLQHEAQHLEALARALPRPQQILATMVQRLDDWSERLDGSLPRLVAAKLQQFSAVSNRLNASLVAPMLQQKLHNLMVQAERLTQRIQQRVTQEEHKLTTLARVLTTMDVKNVLARGFALVKGKDGIITRAADAQGAMRVEWADGAVDVAVTTKKQGDLF